MRIKEWREAAGLTQPELCRKAPGVRDAPLLSKMERGWCNPTPETFRELCAALDASPEQLASPQDVDYGIRTSKRPGDRHKAKWRLTYRPKREAEFAWALAVLGMTPTEWFRKYEALAIQRAKKKAQAEDRSFDEGACKNTLSSKYHKGGGLSNG